jgi:VWFA-related protein
MKPVVHLLIVLVLAAQDVTVRSTTRLVVAPLSVTDPDGRPVEGLRARDMVVFDNDVPVQSQIEETIQPLSLILVVQATASAQSALDKLRKETSLLGPLILGDRGEAAVLAFGEEVRVVQEFTRDIDSIERSVRNLDGNGSGGRLVDAIGTALRMLEKRSPQRRRAILLVSEKHDRGSTESLESVVRMAERVNAVIYGLNFSPTKTAFAKKAPTYCDPNRKCRRCTCGNCALHCDREQPGEVPSDQPGGMNLFAIFGELKRQTQPNVPAALAKLTGGDTWDFVRRKGLGESVQRMGDDLHRQYVLTFRMAKTTPGTYHTIRVTLKDRPDVTARTRSGYYEIADQ